MGERAQLEKEDNETDKTNGTQHDEHQSKDWASVIEKIKHVTGCKRLRYDVRGLSITDQTQPPHVELALYDCRAGIATWNDAIDKALKSIGWRRTAAQGYLSRDGATPQLELTVEPIPIPQHPNSSSQNDGAATPPARIALATRLYTIHPLQLFIAILVGALGTWLALHPVLVALLVVVCLCQ